MRINGKKYLDKNDYDRIIIDLTNEKDYKINIDSKVSYDTVKSTYPFSDRLNKISDEEKILCIFDYFINYSKIDKVVDKEIFDNYDGWFSTVRTLNNRLLMLKLGDNNLSKDLVKKINDEYNINRYNYCMSNDINHIEVRNGRMLFGNNYLLINEKIKADSFNNLRYEISKEDKLFLKELLLSKFDNVNNAYIEEKKDKPLFINDYYLICGNLKIEFSYKLKEDVLTIINEYNYELNKEQKKQTRLM